MRTILFLLLVVCSISNALDTREKLQTVVTEFLATGEVSYEGFVPNLNFKIGKLTWKGTNPNAEPIVIVPGRGEIAYQWAETAYDIRTMGFDGDIIVWDPPGQGLSDRLIPNDPEAGHINRYQDYESALLDFLYSFKKRGLKPTVIAHSMGGMIAINTLSIDDRLASRLILDDPMLDIHLSNNKILQYFEKGVLELLNRLNLLQGLVVGRSGAGHPTTSDLDRKEFRETLQRRDGHIPVPGKTLHWVSEANRGIKSALARAHYIKIPITLFVGTNDHVIDPDGANELQEACKGNCELVIIRGSEHSIHEEVDSIRLQFLNKIAQILNLDCNRVLRSNSRRLSLTE